jgi:hypothetical protein
MLVRSREAIELVAGHLLTHHVAAVVGKPKLPGQRLPVEIQHARTKEYGARKWTVVYGTSMVSTGTRSTRTSYVTLSKVWGAALADLSLSGTHNIFPRMKLHTWRFQAIGFHHAD